MTIHGASSDCNAVTHGDFRTDPEIVAFGYVADIRLVGAPATAHMSGSHPQSTPKALD